MIGLSLLFSLVRGSLMIAGAPAERDGALESLLGELQNERSSADATEELLRRGKADPEVRRYLANRLPVLLEEYHQNAPGLHDNFVWGNEAKLAGELKIAEASPALCKRIEMMTTPARGGSLGYNFIDREAVRSLILIGAPAVPAVADVLKHGRPIQRQEAAYILGEIGTEAARQALNERHEKESDATVLQRMEEALKRPKR